MSIDWGNVRWGTLKVLLKAEAMIPVRDNVLGARCRFFVESKGEEVAILDLRTSDAILISGGETPSWF